MKVEAAIARSQILALLHAKEAAGDGIRKLNAALHRRFAEEVGNILMISRFYVPAIGFGIGPGKCGTCSPARRSRSEQFHRPISAHDAFSDRKWASRTAITHGASPKDWKPNE